jgi:hypothetical protein
MVDDWLAVLTASPLPHTASCRHKITRMSAERESLIARLNEVRASQTRVIQKLEVSDANTAAIIERLGNGDALGDALGPISEQLADYLRELKELEVARHQARTAAFVLGLADGLSIGQIARLFGISRQRAQRFAKEARLTDA